MMEMQLTIKENPVVFSYKPDVTFETPKNGSQSTDRPV